MNKKLLIRCESSSCRTMVFSSTIFINLTAGDFSSSTSFKRSSQKNTIIIHISRVPNELWRLLLQSNRNEFSFNVIPDVPRDEKLHGIGNR